MGYCTLHDGDDWGVIGHRVSVVGVGAAVTRSQVQAQASFEL